MKRQTLLTRAVAILVAPALGLLVVGSALAGGGGPTPGPYAIYFRPLAFTLTPAGEVVLGGNLECNEVAEGTIAVAIAQPVGQGEDGGPYTSGEAFDIVGEASLDVRCDEPGVQEVSLVVSPDGPRGFRPGSATVELEFAYVTATELGDIWGILFPDLRPGNNPI
jgi:hypothetical protein